MSVALLIVLGLILFVLLRCESRLAVISIAVQQLDWRDRKMHPILPGEAEREAALIDTERAGSRSPSAPRTGVSSRPA